MFQSLVVLCTGVVFCVDLSLARHEVCNGQDFLFEESPYYPPFSFSLTYFTSSKPGSVPVLVRSKTKIKDAHFELKGGRLYIPVVTERDDGIFSFHHTDEPHEFVRLKVEDCTVQKTIGYGETLRIKMPYDTIMEFSTPTGDSVVLWNGMDLRTHSKRWGRTGGMFYLKDMTPAYRGTFSVKRPSGSLVSKTHVTVEPKFVSENLLVGTDLTIEGPFDLRNCSMYFLSSEGEENLLISNGRLTYYAKYKFNYGIEKDHLSDWYSKVVITDLQPDYAGVYEIRDSHGTLVQRVDLTVIEESFSWEGIVVPCISVIGAVLLCCCFSRCCRKSDKPADSPVEDDNASDPNVLAPQYSAQPPAAPPSYTFAKMSDFAKRNPAVPVPRYQAPPPTAVPSNTWTYHPPVSSLGDSSSHPSNEIVTTAHVTPLLPEMVDESQDAAPSFPLSTGGLHLSEPAVQFEPSRRGDDFLSSFPLNRETDINPVYNSDKLNFQ